MSTCEVFGKYHPETLILSPAATCCSSTNSRALGGTGLGVGGGGGGSTTCGSTGSGNGLGVGSARTGSGAGSWMFTAIVFDGQGPSRPGLLSHFRAACASTNPCPVAK